jgi:hypothetical protein
MTENQSMFVFVTGLLMTLGGVGGVEHSVDNAGLLGGLAIAVLGLAVTYVGTLGLRNADFYK